jgi:hypothetical protein
LLSNFGTPEPPMVLMVFVLSLLKPVSSNLL